MITKKKILLIVALTGGVALVITILYAMGLGMMSRTYLLSNIIQFFCFWVAEICGIVIMIFANLDE